MTLSYVLFLFLVHLGVGVIGTLVLVPRVAGVQFFRFNAGFGAALLLIALALRPDDLVFGSDVQGIALASLICSTGAILVYWATIGRVMGWLRPVWLWLAVVSGLVAVVGLQRGNESSTQPSSAASPASTAPSASPVKLAITAADDPTQQRLFDGLVEAASSRRSGG